MQSVIVLCHCIAHRVVWASSPNHAKILNFPYVIYTDHRKIIIISSGSQIKQYGMIRKQSLQKQNSSGYCLTINFAVGTLNKLRNRSLRKINKKLKIFDFLTSLLLSYISKNLQEAATTILSGDEDYHHRHWKPHCRKVQ